MIERDKVKLGGVYTINGARAQVTEIRQRLNAPDAMVYVYIGGSGHWHGAMMEQFCALASE